jgi:hypothetical protein
MKVKTNNNNPSASSKKNTGEEVFKPKSNKKKHIKIKDCVDDDDDPFMIEEISDIDKLPCITLVNNNKKDEVEMYSTPIPICHNIVSTSQIISSMKEIDLQRLASLFPFTSYDRKRFAAITIRLANPHCTCLLFGSGKLVITGSTSFHACIVASQTITEMLREVNLR